MHKILSLNLLLWFLLISPVVFGQEAGFDQWWREAEKAADKGLPKTALESISQIREKALVTHDNIQLIRANLFQYSLMQTFEEDHLAKAIAHAETQLPLISSPEKELMHSLLAEMYWFYYQQNRFRLLDRANLQTASSDDLSEWDLLTLRNVINDHYERSLLAQSSLDTIPIGRYQSLLNPIQKEAMIVQPTLFDFVAARALEFYQAKDAGLTEAVRLQRLNQREFWNPVVDFTTLHLPMTNAEPFGELRLRQKLLLSNLKQGHTDALIWNEIKRYRLVHQHWENATEADSLLLRALRQLHTTFAKHPASAEILAEMAAFLLENPDENKRQPAVAIELCREAAAAFPESRGGKRAVGLSNQILQKDLSFEIQRVQVPGQAIPLRLQYRNVTEPALRILAITSEKLENITTLRTQEEQLLAFLSLQPVFTKTLSLPFEADYKSHSTVTDLPPLTDGLYVLLVADNPAFEPGKIITYTSFQVSRLAFINRKDKDINTFYLLDRESGQPISKAFIRVMGREYDYTQKKYLVSEKARLITAKDGSFSFGPEEIQQKNQAFFIEAAKDNDTLYSDSYFDVYQRPKNERIQQRSWFFTDRSIYRPGQTVFFKAISLERTGQEPWKIEENKTDIVRLYDVNNREVASITLTTNAFGSYEGSFTIPQGLLTGNMRIAGQHGGAYFSVEEYKRPTFEVVIETAARQFKLNETVAVGGQARAFAGFGLDSVVVEYTVAREINLPYRRYGWPGIFPPFSSDRKIIASGTTFTGLDGSFEIRFDALEAAETNLYPQSVYIYTIEASVTDRNGETRQGSTAVNVSNRALLIGTSLGETVEAKTTSSILLNTKNLQHQAVDAKVDISFFRLKPHETILRPAMWPHTDRQYFQQEKYRLIFPFDDFTTPNDSVIREKTLVWEGIQQVKGNGSLFPAEAVNWPEGEYLVRISAVDNFGQPVTYEQSFSMFKNGSRKMPAKELAWFHLSHQEAQPGDTILFYAGSAEKSIRVLIEIRSGNDIVYKKWHRISNSLKTIPFVVEEKHRGKLRFEAAFVRHNRLMHFTADVNVPHSDKMLDIQLLTSRDKLEPGAEENWTVVVKDHQGRGKTAEMLAAMYDASLDAFQGHKWTFDVLPYPVWPQAWSSDPGFLIYGSNVLSWWPPTDLSLTPIEPHTVNWFGLGPSYNYYGRGDLPLMMQKSQHQHDESSVVMEAVIGEAADATNGTDTETTGETTVDKAQATYLRSDFRETAFFYPKLTTDENGLVSFSFRTPDALTRWKLMLLAHTIGLETGLKELEFTASRQLMIIPNLPRFYREGDTVRVSAKIMNTGNDVLNGIAKIKISDALNGNLIHTAGNPGDKAFLNLLPGQSKQLTWEMIIGESHPLLAVQLSATAGSYTDSEQRLIPVLPNGIIVTESMQLHIPGNSTQSRTIQGLKEARSGEKNLRLHLGFTTNPAWYAVKALPSMAEKGTDNVDNIFNRYYANSLAAWIANSIPGAMEVINAWKTQGSKSLISNLNKHAGLKAVLLEETPWVFDAADESNQQQQLNLLFDLNRLRYDQEEALKKIQQLQLPDGSWSWFPGMPGSRYITQNIVAGYGKLKKLTALSVARNDMEAVVAKALNYLDANTLLDYKKMTDRRELSQYTLQHQHLDYLYARSFFPGHTGSDEVSVMADFLLSHTATDWKTLSTHDQAIALLVMLRSGNQTAADAIMASLRERAISQKELGTYWKQDNVRFGQHSDTRSQAAMIEAFEEAGAEKTFIDNMRIWLLAQKRTHKWETNTATADAIYALLMNGNNWLVRDQNLKVTAGNQTLVADKIEAGTGDVDFNWYGSDIRSELADIVIENPQQTPAWGSVFRQYEVAADQVKAAQTSLSIRRELYIEQVGKNGIELVPLNERQLRVGDKLKVRLIISTDRELEYIHVRDLRAAALEPVETLSAYHSDAGLSYYRAPKDVATDFFFHYLPKGKSIVEYTLLATQAGTFSNGYALIQSYYAPEFSAHSTGLRIEVREK